MSTQEEGVVFQTTEEAAAEFFCSLVPKTELRLAPLDGETLFGIYSEEKSQKELFTEISRLASLKFDVALCYGHYSAVGFICELFENGKQTRNLASQTDWADNWGSAPLFGAFGYSREEENHLHKAIEATFGWGHDRWLLEHTPSYDRYR